MHRLTGGLIALLLAALPSIAAPPETAYAVVLLKDGFALRGFVRQDEEVVVDSSSRSIEKVPKGFYYLDDRVRQIFFSHHYVRSAPVKHPFDTTLEIKLPKQPPNGPAVPPVRDILDLGPWNEQWERGVKFNSPAGRISITQHILALTPQYARTISTAKDYNRYRWVAGYRTSELGPTAVADLLSHHPDTRDDPKRPPEERIARRLLVVNFLVQAGWTEEGQKELARLRKEFPKEKERLDTAEEGLRRLVAFQRYDEARQAQAAGRHLVARGLLASFPEAGAEPKLLSEARALRDAYGSADATLKRTRERLRKLLGNLPEGSEKGLLTEAVTALLAELTYDHFLTPDGKVDRGRLEPFLSQAERAEATPAEGKPSAGPRELLSLAVSGWLLGAASAETKSETAARLWRGRQAILAYQKAEDLPTRQQLLTYLEREVRLSPEEAAQMIGFLPPPEPFDRVTTVPLIMKMGHRTYHLQLPPEYHPGRAYPVLIALHHAGEDGRAMIARWGPHAARHGYILAAPDWGAGLQLPYTYTSDDHSPVVETLRDLTRRFSVDSDRVFLTGYGEGGNMAYDVGLSHPDLFAGLVPIAGQPRFHVFKYWPNAQYLPVYAVWGERMGAPEDSRPGDTRSDGNRANYDLFKEWVPYGYPALGLQYLGRGREWFTAELDDAFDWMGRKKRAHPLTQLGRDGGGSATGGTEFRTMRAGDNQFYWLSTDEIIRGCLCETREQWNWNRAPAMLAAQVPEGNVLHVRASGVKQVTVWLARNTIDFDKPVTVRFNGGKTGVMGRKVKPDLATLLDDFARRGDRQRLFLARLDFKL